jgi:glutamate N-acetyltransferase/amino-acid N-acetyltransferase
MTTDTYRKETACSGSVGRGEVRIGGMAKGSGMIHPNMATMLAFLTTDLLISPALLRTALRDAVDASFHAITVDGETSTNDMVLCMANGKSGVSVRETGKAYRQFLILLRAACWSLAEKIVRDGEGATKQIRIDVSGAEDDRSARRVAMAIAQSPLVKTAFFGEDANWGRIVCAIGNAGVPVDPKKIGLTFGVGIPLIRNGVHLGREAETAVASSLKEKEIVLAVSLGRGRGKSRVLTCDLSLDYIKINAAYRS